MSFYEDSVADGSHCMSCCQYIGEEVGYTRLCAPCGGQPGAGVGGKAAKAARMEQFSKWLASSGVSHSIHNNGYHVVITLADGRKIDCWPSVKKWQLRGSKMSRDGSALNQLVRSSP